MDEQQMADVFQAYVDGVSGDDVNAILDLYTDDAVVEDPVGSEPHRGREALREFYQMAIDTVEKMTLEGRPRTRGQANAGAAAMRAYPKGGNGMYIETTDVMTFNDAGKITSMTAYWGDSSIRSGD